MYQAYLYRRVVQAKIFIDANYHDNINLNNIADEACFSKFHFIRLFKNIYKRTPHQYLRYVRIQKALLLLKEGITVSDTCFEVGFESLGSFSTIFKEIVGVAPSVFLQNEQERQMKISASPYSFIPGCHAKRHNIKSNFEEVL